MRVLRAVLLLAVAVVTVLLTIRFFQVVVPTWGDVPLLSSTGKAGIAGYCISDPPPPVVDIWFRTTTAGQTSRRFECSCDDLTAVLNAIDTCCEGATADSSGRCGDYHFHAKCDDPPGGNVLLAATNVGVLRTDLVFTPAGGLSLPTPGDVWDRWSCTGGPPQNEPNGNLEELRATWRNCCM